MKNISLPGRYIGLPALCVATIAVAVIALSNGSGIAAAPTGNKGVATEDNQSLQTVGQSGQIKEIL
ncbi:hypothetical protein [Glaciimonas soli]|uniref:Uncharacterized protein n=1 Tax=Glaciimonas soli TaxID=2590999 RepID=A0A843YJW6_9BURK|nr:hypothetical protein [Glaciimonas soli]MQQ99269.1 hypothetical protein [Glaciimonas soli]